MKPINEYPISFPYGTTSAPYSATHPHRGDDRKAPCGTPINIGTTLIGNVGTTGKSTGCHLHIQEWQGNKASVRKPQNAFKGGTVVENGNSADFGNYITIRSSDGWNDTYAHMQRPSPVKVGNTVGSGTMNDMIDSQEKAEKFLAATLHAYNPATAKSLIGLTYQQATENVMKDIIWKVQDANLNAYLPAILSELGGVPVEKAIETIRKLKSGELKPQVLSKGLYEVQ
jgi:hypothetical protein